MSRRNLFRVTTIRLDEDEEVASVTAIASEEALEFLRTAAASSYGAVPAGPGPAEVTLSRRSLGHLHNLAAEVSGDDPLSEGSGAVYESMCMVIYGLIERT